MMEIYALAIIVNANKIKERTRLIKNGLMICPMKIMVAL